MSDGPTYCDACDHVETASRRQSRRQWLCLMHPKLPAFDGFVSQEDWEKDEPYLRCSQVNGGVCRLFRAKRTPQMELIGENDG